MSKENLQKPIEGIIIKFKEIIFGVDSPICIRTLKGASN